MNIIKTVWRKIYPTRLKYWFRSRQIMSTRRRTLYEIDKALHFNSAITDSKWLRNKGFTPGGCAADYGALLSIFKVLNIMQPERTLEFGLGQSSKLIHQYAAYFGKSAVTVESDPVWTDFFRRSIDEAYPVNVSFHPAEQVTYKGKKTLAYTNLESITAQGPYDFVFVDGPFGSKHYSRSQILGMLPDGVSDNYCIIIHDMERYGEQQTLEEAVKILTKAGKEPVVRLFHGEKSHAMLCSRSLYFLTTV